jgi:hypothetical protein
MVNRIHYYFPATILLFATFVLTPKATSAYCDPSGADCETYGEGIMSVEFNTIKSLRTGCNEDGYGDYTNMSTNVRRGETHTLTILPLSNSPVGITVWIDWNNNGDFSAGDRVPLYVENGESELNLSQVEYIANGVLVATSDANGFAAEWHAAQPGTYQIVARAHVDGLRSVAQSSPVTIIVDGASGRPGTVGGRSRSGSQAVVQEASKSHFAPNCRHLRTVGGRLSYAPPTPSTASTLVCVYPCGVPP